MRTRKRLWFRELRPHPAAAAAPLSPAPRLATHPMQTAAHKAEAAKALGVILRGIELFGKEQSFLPCQARLSHACTSPYARSQRLFLNSLLWRDSVHFLQERGCVIIENRKGTFVAPKFKDLDGLKCHLEATVRTRSGRRLRPLTLDRPTVRSGSGKRATSGDSSELSASCAPLWCRQRREEQRTTVCRPRSPSVAQWPIQSVRRRSLTSPPAQHEGHLAPRD